MKSLFWKRIIEVKNQKMRVAISLVLSATILFLSVFIFKNNFNIVFAYSPLAIMAINHVALSSMEDILFCETLISCNISLMKIWYFNLLFICIGNYFISVTLLGGYALLVGIFPGYLYVVQNILSLILSASLLGCATIHYANYSKENQYVGTVFGLLFIVIPFAFVEFVGFLPVTPLSLLYSIVVSVILSVFAYLFMVHSSKEKILINTTKISSMMNQRILEE